MTRSDHVADSDDPDLFGRNIPKQIDLATFLPLRVAQSLTGHRHIVDAGGATFVDRAFQLRGFRLRPDFKDEFDSLAPQIVDACNRYGPLKAGATEARRALESLSGQKLPAEARKLVGRALMALVEGMKG